VGKLLTVSEKLKGCRNGTGLLYQHTEFGGDCMSHVDSNGESFCLFVTLATPPRQPVVNGQLSHLMTDSTSILGGFVHSFQHY